VLATSGEIYGTPWRVADLPPYLPAAMIAIEDRRFYRHFGVDLIGLARAAWVNWRAGRTVQGGSTITQQVAKTVFLSPERTLKRKVQEALLALWLERRFTKDQILGIYLNRVYLGAGTYGVDAAARRYFGVAATDVSLGQAAVLAGLLQAPVRLSPARDPSAAANRARVVLRAMVATGAATQADADAARLDGIALAGSIAPRTGRAFADWALEQTPGYAGPKGALDRDLAIRTTLDPRLQQAVETAAATAIDAEGPARHASEVAVVVLAPDGAVRAMVGGRDYRAGQFNRATQALRQPGSAFKPFVYLTGLEVGMTPATMVLDAPFTVGTWSPRNYERQFRGEITLTEALTHSVNTATARLAQDVGVRAVTATARRLGIASDLPKDLTLALGTGEVTLLELTAAYAAISRGGVAVWPYAIAGIDARLTDGSDYAIWRRAGDGPGRVASETAMADLDLMLAEVVRRGTGRAAQPQIPGVAVRAAGKTGTTQDFRDAWFVGYAGPLDAAGERDPNRSYTVGVWIGNDDGQAMKGVTGGDMPARLWRRAMEAALTLAPIQPPPISSSAPQVLGFTTAEQ
jgi:penicillin-binding protein 1A